MIHIEKYIVLFYNEMTESEVETILEIPPAPLKMLQAFSYEELIRPFVIRDLSSGMSRDQIQIKYSVKNNFGRKIGRKIGRFKKKHCKKNGEKVPSN